MAATLLYPLILLAGVLQAIGAALNAQLRKTLGNPRLAATVSFLPVVFVFAVLVLVFPTPLPTRDTLATMPFYAPLGGLAGAVAVFGALTLVDKVGAGPFNGLTITGNIVTSLLLDTFALFGLKGGGFKPVPWVGAALMVAGVVLIARSGRGSDEEQEGGIGGALIYPFILGGGALQALGVTWNALLHDALTNPFLAAAVSFLPVVIAFALLTLVRPSPLPSRRDFESLRWWVPLAGLAGAGAVFAGLTLVDTVGAGLFNGLLITANLLTAVGLDHFGWLGLKQVRAGPARICGAALMIGGIVLISLK